MARLLALVRQPPRFGYRRIGALLRREGGRGNRKRTYRLWKQQGLKVPRQQRKKRRLGSRAQGCVRRRAAYRNHVWAWDFIFDRTRDGRVLKWLTLVDEYPRECLALGVGRGMTARAVIAVLAAVIRERGAPGCLRSDNGPEFIAAARRGWLADQGIEAPYGEPGSPWENGYAESFNSKVRDELLEREEFGRLLEAQVLARDWRHDYNHVRPHSALGYRAPAEFGELGPRADSAKPTPSRGPICDG